MQTSRLLSYFLALSLILPLLFLLAACGSTQAEAKIDYPVAKMRVQPALDARINRDYPVAQVRQILAEPLPSETLSDPVESAVDMPEPAPVPAEQAIVEMPLPSEDVQPLASEAATEAPTEAPSEIPTTIAETTPAPTEAPTTAPRLQGSAPSGLTLINQADLAPGSDIMEWLRTTKRPVLIDLSQDSCPDCDRLAPSLHELAAQLNGQLIVVEINLDRAIEGDGRLLDFARQQGIERTPTILLYVGGQRVKSRVGSLNTQGLREFVAEYVN